ncbi:hypothetical protein HUJ04_011059, partial [Dendroctonus ponderosae]
MKSTATDKKQIVTDITTLQRFHNGSDHRLVKARTAERRYGRQTEKLEYISKEVRKFNKDSFKQTREENRSKKILRKNISIGKKEIFALQDKTGTQTNNREKGILQEHLHTVAKKAKRRSVQGNVPIGLKSRVKRNIPDISVDEVEHAIRKLKNNKAPGEDGV